MSKGNTFAWRTPPSLPRRHAGDGGQSPQGFLSGDVSGRRAVADRQSRAARVTGEELSLVVEMEFVHDPVHERGQHERGGTDE